MLTGSIQVQSLSGLPEQTVAQGGIDIRGLIPGGDPGPGETVLTKAQFQALNKTLDLSGVPRKGGPRGPAFQFGGWSGAKGGSGVNNPAYPKGTTGWEFTTQKPISMGGKLSIPSGSTVTSGPTAKWPLNVTLPSSDGKSASSLIQFQAGTVRDTGIRTTKIVVQCGDGKKAKVELIGTFFLDQKNGEMKMVRLSGEGKYIVQTLQNALKDDFKEDPVAGRAFADALKNAGVSR